MSLFDEIRKRTARYILQSETILVRSVAGFGVFTGRCNSFIGKLESCIDDQRQFEMAVYLYNCSNFSTSDRMHEINFGNLKFFVGLGFPHWVLVLISAYHWFPVKLPITYAHDTGKKRHFGSGSAHVRSLPNFSQQKSPLLNIYGVATRL